MGFGVGCNKCCNEPTCGCQALCKDSTVLPNKSCYIPKQTLQLTLVGSGSSPSNTCNPNCILDQPITKTFSLDYNYSLDRVGAVEWISPKDPFPGYSLDKMQLILFCGPIGPRFQTLNPTLPQSFPYTQWNCDPFSLVFSGFPLFGLPCVCPTGLPAMEFYSASITAAGSNQQSGYCVTLCLTCDPNAQAAGNTITITPSGGNANFIGLTNDNGCANINIGNSGNYHIVVSGPDIETTDFWQFLACGQYNLFIPNCLFQMGSVPLSQYKATINYNPQYLIDSLQNQVGVWCCCALWQGYSQRSELQPPHCCQSCTPSPTNCQCPVNIGAGGGGTCINECFSTTSYNFELVASNPSVTFNLNGNNLWKFGGQGPGLFPISELQLIYSWIFSAPSGTPCCCFPNRLGITTLQNDFATVGFLYAVASRPSISCGGFTAGISIADFTPPCDGDFNTCEWTGPGAKQKAMDFLNSLPTTVQYPYTDAGFGQPSMGLGLEAFSNDLTVDPAMTGYSINCPNSFTVTNFHNVGRCPGDILASTSTYTYNNG